MKRIDMKQRFPAGYVDPAHTHTSWYSILVTKGRLRYRWRGLGPLTSADFFVGRL